MQHHTVETAKHFMDTAAIVAWLAYVGGVISTFIVPFLTAAWLAIRIWESKTCQCWRAKRIKK